MIIITNDKLPSIGIELLKSKFNDIFVLSNDTTESDRIEYYKNANAILSLLRDKFDGNILEQCKKLKVISNYAVGYDNIDINTAKKLKIRICNTPDVLTDTTADLAFGIMMAAARKICVGQQFLRKGLYHGWEPDLFLGYDIYGKTIGIIGAGKIGQAIGKRSLGFNMKIIYYKRNRDSDFENTTGAIYSSMNDILKRSDFISLNTPLTKDTYHLIGKKEFSLMKPNSILINTSRGSVINEKALVDALKNRKIASCALDVFEFEPQVTKELMLFDNIILTPHIGSASYETRNKMALIAAQNIVDVLSNNKCNNIVNGG